MGLADQARKLLAWTKKVQPVMADGARPDGPRVWIRSDDGSLMPTAADGTWIYAARSY